MKAPLGFGKNYFTFSAMLAYNVRHKLQSQVSSILDENDAPPDIPLEIFISQNKKPCHCNYYFKLKTKITLLLNHYIPRCPFYCTYFAFRRTGVHPPIILY